jgi:hypothetical protein
MGQKRRFAAVAKRPFRFPPEKIAANPECLRPIEELFAELNSEED